MAKKTLNLEELNYVKVFIELFEMQHSYVGIREVDKVELHNFITKFPMQSKSIDTQIELVFDWVVSQDLCSVTL